LRIVFDNSVPGAVSAKAYESAVALAASLAWRFATENADVSFATQQYEGNDIHQFLSHLAVVEPGESLSYLEGLQPSSGYSIVVTSRSRGTIPTALWTNSYFVFMGGRDEQSNR